MANRYQRERNAILSVRELANQAFSRAAGAPLVGGNCVRLLKDAKENYPAWLDAIKAAERYIHFESYIIHEDKTGWMFADALVAKAREGVRVRLIYDWMGGLGKTSRARWRVRSLPDCLRTLRRRAEGNRAGRGNIRRTG